MIIEGNHYDDMSHMGKQLPMVKIGGPRWGIDQPFLWGFPIQTQEQLHRFVLRSEALVPQPPELATEQHAGKEVRDGAIQLLCLLVLTRNSGPSMCLLYGKTMRIPVLVLFYMENRKETRSPFWWANKAHPTGFLRRLRTESTKMDKQIYAEAWFPTYSLQILLK